MHKDSTERLIEKGAYIAYVVTTGSTGGVKFGRVVKLKEKLAEKNVYNAATKGYDQESVTEYSIQIISVEKNWRTKGKWEVQGKREGRFAKVQSIERLDRVIVLEAHQMNPEAKEALDKEMLERGA